MILRSCWISFSVIVLICIACGSKEDIPVEEELVEPVKPEVVVEKSVATPPGKAESFELVIIDSTKEAKIASFVESYKALFRVKDLSSKSELNRYANETGVLYEFESYTDSLAKPFRLGFFVFKDSMQVKNLKRNWFNSFGDSRIEITEGVERSEVAHEPIQAGFYETELYLYYRDCSQPLNEEQEQLIRDFKKYFMDGTDRKLIVDCAQNLNWK
jgi:hypothetical protein